jgi:hypothetical protein
MNCRLTAFLLLGSLASSTAVWAQTNQPSQGGQTSQPAPGAQITSPSPALQYSQQPTRGDTLKERMRREDYYNRIDRKLEKDLTSTRVIVLSIPDYDPEDVERKLSFPVDTIWTSDGTRVVMHDEKSAALLYVKNEGEPSAPASFDVIPLAIRSRQEATQEDSAAADSMRLGLAAKGLKSYPIKVHLKDIARLDVYKQRQIVDYIVERSAKGASDSLFIPEWIAPMSPVNPNHRDFWSYAKVTDRFLVPPLEGKDAKTSLGPPEFLGYTVDASFSKISLAHELLYSEDALGIPRFGIEVGFDDPILSLLPFQAPAVSYGAMLFFNSTSEQEDVLDRKYLQLKLMGRSRFNAKKFSEDMGAAKYIFTPLTSSDTPTLNIAVPGYGVEVMTSKLGSLPYLSVLYTAGSNAYENPVYAFGPANHRYAFWSTVQWRGSMAFYFNLDSEPEYFVADPSGKRLNIVRLDLGAGTYNVARVQYDSTGQIETKTGIVKSSRIQPYFAVEYVHASRTKTAFGAKATYFDNRVTLTAWISLFKLGYHELRLEGTDILGPFGRARFEWETTGNALIQFRYRLGF